MDKQFNFTKPVKTILLLLIGLGVVSLIMGIISHDVNSHRLWANILLNNYYTMGLSLAALVFIAVHSLGDSGWQTSIQRVPEAISMYIPVAALLMIIFIFGMNEVYHWTDTAHLDKILLGKKPYLNKPFFIIRMVVYFAGWIFFAWKIRQISLNDDLNPQENNFKRMRAWCAYFIVFYAVTSSTSAWDFLMSIDSHWFSTLYGWYMFASTFVSGIAVIILFVVALKKAGYLPHVNGEHLHDLGKYLFGFSIFWAYLWFSQFMLIWYANIPEETIYFVQRIEDPKFQPLFIANFLINFLIPFLALMTRGSKRQMGILAATAVVVIIGHWIDMYLAIMPGAVGSEHAGIGFFEIGLSLGYFALMAFVTLHFLTKASLVPKNHPFLKESFEYDNI